jgi:eukaryotic-like serine/threonine-protein kinase
MRIVFTITAGPLAGQVFKFEGHDVFLVGRSPNAHCRFPEDDPFFSRVHFLIEVNPPRCRLTDMSSRNGTFVNGRKVEVIDLADQDEIRAGHTRILVRVEQPLENLPPLSGDASDTQTDVRIPDLNEYDSPLTAPSSSPATEIELSASILIPRGEPQLPGYQLIRELGRGNMGIVYLARRQADGHEVAVKTVHPTQIGNPQITTRFLREAETLGRFNHPNIVTFHGAGEAGGLLYFVMEYVAGTDVGKVLLEKPRVEIRTAIRLAIQVLDALSHAHTRGLVHRDIKPANVLLADLPNGKRQVKLADFGLARVYRASQISGLTHLGDLGGTPAYMPPEQITNYREVMPAADQYSTAAMLYHMLTGRWVFDLQPMPAGLLTILNKEPVPLCSRRPDLPHALGTVIHKALAKNPADRYPDVVAFRHALVPFGR